MSDNIAILIDKWTLMLYAISTSKNVIIGGRKKTCRMKLFQYSNVLYQMKCIKWSAKFQNNHQMRLT